MDLSINEDGENSDSQDDNEEPVKSQSVTFEDQFQENPDPTPHFNSVTPLYYSIMEDEGLDEVFIQPPFLPSHLDPEGGSTCQAPDTYMSVSLRSSDATTANTNPECLDGHHGERQITPIHSQENEEMENAKTNFGNVERRNSSCGIQCGGQDLKLMEDSVVQDSEDKVEESYEKPAQMVEHKAIADMDLLEETGIAQTCQNLESQNLAYQGLQTVTADNQSKMDASIIQCPDNPEEDEIKCKLVDVRTLNSELKEYDWVKRTRVEDAEETVAIGQRELNAQENESKETSQDSSIATEILQGEDLLQRLQLVQQRQDLAVSCQETSKAEEGVTSKDHVGKEDTEIIQEIPNQERTEQEPKVETSVFSETEHVEHCFIHNTDGSRNEDSETRKLENQTEMCAKDACVHLEQEMERSEQIAGTDQLTEDRGLEDECGKTEGADDEGQTYTEEHVGSNNEDDSQEERDRTSLPPLYDEKSNRKPGDVEETDSWSSASEILFPSHHRLSAAETHMEKQFHRVSQLKQDLQRAEGVLDLSDNPDILEIPFKSNFSLEPLPRRDEVQSSEWHFSEQKMQKEISQEMQRELVLVNLGKIPGGYSKGESRQMKDTKMLFEEFQQDKPEGPTRIRKPQTSSQIYPSVLERTRSLEMFSHTLSPVLRTQSFRLMSSSEKEKHTETFRSQSPSSRDKARLSPYPKHEKLPRKHKSMDCINTVSPTTSADRVRKSKEEPVREGSPLLKENPFFKLRPALSLQPEVEKDIREAKKREEELRKQRSSLYGETRQVSKEEGKSTARLQTGSNQKPTGRLERVWPPPSTKDPTKAEQQEARVQRTPGHRAALWQRWESGLINGQTPNANNN